MASVCGNANVIVVDFVTQARLRSTWRKRKAVDVSGQNEQPPDSGLMGFPVVLPISLGRICSIDAAIRKLNLFWITELPASRFARGGTTSTISTLIWANDRKVKALIALTHSEIMSRLIANGLLDLSRQETRAEQRP